MWSLLYAILALGLATRSFAQNAMAISSLFNIDLSSNSQGGCSYVGQTFLQDILQDSYNLATIGSRLATDYSNNVAEARRLLDSFFEIENPPLSQSQVQAISNAYSTVSTWIAQGGAYNGDTRTGQPYLFCYHNWLEKKTMQSEAQDTLGETFPDVWTGTPALINQVPGYVEIQQEQSSALGARVQAVPYWSDKHKSYIFDRSYGRINAGICSNRNYLAATQHALNPSTMTLCPMSFGAAGTSFTSTNLGTIKYLAPRSVTPTPVARAIISAGGTGNQDLSKVTPTAATFFHEIFHLVLGNDVTYPEDIGEVYNVFPITQQPSQIVGLDYANAIVNPESFALAAIAYDYTVNWAPDATGNAVEFYSGWATQG